MLHPVLSALETELRQVVSAVKGVTADGRPASLMHNNFGCAGVDRDELMQMAQNLADRIATEGSETLTANETLLTQYSARLQFLRASTVPNLFNGNAATSIPAYLITLQGLERALEPTLTADPVQVAEDAKAAKTLHTKLRGLNSRITELDPKVDVLQTMASQIVEAHAAADQLPTDLATLRETQEEISSLRNLVARDQVAANMLLEQIRRSESELQSDISKSTQDIIKRQQEWEALKNSSTESASSIISRCEDAMRTSTSFGLAGAFHEQAESLNKSILWWVAGLIVALLAGAIAGSLQLHKLTDAIQASTPPMIIWTRLLISLFSVAAPVWFSWIATKQIGQRFRLSQDYAYKASISKAYEGYRREAVQLDAEFQTRLFSSALTRMNEQPLRFVEQKTHGSPWHELLDSDLFKDAIKIAPDLVGKFAAIARERVEATKKPRAQPKVPSMGDESAEA